MSEGLTKYVLAQKIDRGRPGMAPEWPAADPRLNRFYLAADVDARLREREEEAEELSKALMDNELRWQALTADLHDQLVAMTAERDEWKEKVRWKHVHDDSVKIALHKHLAVAQQRIVTLRERQFLLEARQILGAKEGEAMYLPEREHLVALEEYYQVLLIQVANDAEALRRKALGA